MVKEDVCVDDNSISDLYGQTCASLYDSSPEYCGQLDNAQFSAATLCCACGGGVMTEMVKEDVCVDDNSISDLYGQTCASLYDSSPEYCGQLDSAQFSAATLCCACGGGAM